MGQATSLVKSRWKGSSNPVGNQDGRTIEIHPQPIPTMSRLSSSLASISNTLRRRPQTTSPGTDNPHSSVSYVDNSVCTARYTVVSFLPKQLYYQFSKFANLYFAFIAALQAVPGWSPTGRFTTIFPLTLFVALSMLREAYDDYYRHKQDARENNSQTHRFNPTKSSSSQSLHHRKTTPIHDTPDVEPMDMVDSRFFESVRWRDLKVGDIVMVKDKEIIPADLIVIGSALPQGACYIETSNLDGETNLKHRQAIEATYSLVSDAASLGHLDFVIQAEHPNGNLYGFEGYIQINENGMPQRYPLTVHQMVLRGSTLRNSKFMYGVVTYTGEESKIRKNATVKPRTKSPAMERMTNKVIVVLFTCILILASISTGASFGWKANVGEKGHWYLDTSPDPAGTFFSFIILYNALIPISLYVTMEMVKLAQIYFINNDVSMYDPVSDRFAEARTSSLNEDLGQVQYVFSDKTGTLTENVMIFRKMCIAGQSFTLKKEKPGKPMYHEADVPCSDLIDQLKRPSLDPGFVQHRDFLKAVALCHSALPEGSLPGAQTEVNSITNAARIEQFKNLVYQSSSPDDVALVAGARDMSFVFHNRIVNKIHLNCLGHNGDEEYVVLNTIEFSSKRKRMSVVLRYPDGSIYVLCKGADSIILERLVNRSSLSPSQQAELDKTMEHVERFASEGLRTLLYSWKKITEAQYEDWSRRYAEASTLLENRQQTMDDIAEELEKGFHLLGATAIEDKLQVGVPETIHKLQEAGIRVWMLTGDKRETAINIGYTCQLIHRRSKLIVLKGNDLKEIEDHIDSSSKSVMMIKGLKTVTDSIETVESSQHVVLVADGDLVTYLLTLEKKGDVRAAAIFTKFLDLAVTCDNVICCRFSPSQKARIVTEVTHMLKVSSDGTIGLAALGKPKKLTALSQFFAAFTFKSTMSGVTLAIGDGANDIPMLESAHVGIGITGREGLAAARASDYSIAQFRFLQNLLLVHGHYNYNRVALFTMGTFYKCMSFYLCQMIFQIWTGWTGTSLFESWTLAVYNIFFSSLPVLAVGIFERDLHKSTLLCVPALYKVGIINDRYNLKKFLRWMAQGVYHAFIAVLVPLILFNAFYSRNGDASSSATFQTTVSDLGKYMFPRLFESDVSGPIGDSGLFAMGTIVYSLVICIVTIKIAYVESRTYTLFTHLFALISVGVWFLYQWVYPLIAATINKNNPTGSTEIGYDAIGLEYQFFRVQGLLWIILVLGCVAALGINDLAFYSWFRIGDKWDWIWKRLKDEENGDALDPGASDSQKAKYAMTQWHRLGLSLKDWARLIPWWQKWEKENTVTLM